MWTAKKFFLFERPDPDILRGHPWRGTTGQSGHTKRDTRYDWYRDRGIEKSAGF